MSDNKIPDNCAGLLLKVVSGQGERLDEIVWSFGLRGELPSNLHSEGMRVYNVSGNELSFQMAKGLEKFLQNNIYLRVLLLQDNLFTETDVNFILQGFELNKALVNLDLRLNSGFTSEHADYIKKI